MNRRRIVILAVLVGLLFALSHWFVRDANWHNHFNGGCLVTIRVQTDKLPMGFRWNKRMLNTMSFIFMSRVNGGMIRAEDLVRTHGSDEIIVTLPRIGPKEFNMMASSMLKASPRLEVKYLSPTQLAGKTARPIASEMHWTDYWSGRYIVTDEKGTDMTSLAREESTLVLTGHDMEAGKASSKKLGHSENYIVSMKLTTEGRDKLTAFKKKNSSGLLIVVADYMGIIGVTDMKDFKGDNRLSLQEYQNAKDAYYTSSALNICALPVQLKVVKVEPVNDDWPIRLRQLISPKTALSNN